jgi:hypothetical protein
MGAIITAVFAVRAFRKQAVEVNLLQKQTERDLAERRRAQAAQVFTYASQGHEGPEMTVMNSSQQPIYNVTVIRPNKVVVPGPGPVAAKAAFAPFLLPNVPLVLLLLPETEWIDIIGQIAVIFRDASGVGWMTCDDGRHIELSDEDFTRYRRDVGFDQSSTS